MFHYRLCGLGICSNVDFPELRICNEAPAGSSDLSLQLSTPTAIAVPPVEWLITWNLEEGTEWLSCGKVDGGYWLRFPELADFSVDSGGRQVVCYPRGDVTGDSIRHLFLDQVLPLVLNLRGTEALHATSVLTEFGVCAFGGPTGLGKSTLAADFMRAGCAVLSDDCLALQRRGDGIFAVPAYAGVRLWDDAKQAIFGSVEPSSSVAQYTSKSRVVLKTQGYFPHEPQRLTRVYSLVEADDAPPGNSLAPMIEPLTAGAALMELIELTFRLDISDRAMLRRQFRFLEQVASTVPVRRLRMPKNFSQLGAVRAAILADLEVPSARPRHSFPS